jgi:hypothetical protein
VQEDERDSFSPVAKKLKVKVHDLIDDESERNRNPEKAKKLIEKQKKQWHDKEREKAHKQIHEQQRILKNLISLNEYQYRLHKPKVAMKDKLKEPKQGLKKKKRKPQHEYF